MGTDTQIDLDQESIVLFDGVCNLCNSTVNFIIDRDRSERFTFGSLQQIAEHPALRPYEEDAKDLSSVMLIDRGRVYKKSSAALHIARQLPGLWPLLYGLIIIPAFIRDWFYDLVASNRYRWFGKQSACRIPEPHLVKRFL